MKLISFNLNNKGTTLYDDRKTIFYHKSLGIAAIESRVLGKSKAKVFLYKG